MTKIIPLTQGKEAIVDDEDFEYLNQWKWFYTSDGYPARSVYFKHKKKKLSMHCAIKQAPDGYEIDHKNRNRLDNRRENLRICTHSQNMANRRRSKNNTSGYKGVSWDTVHKGWHSQIGGRKINGKTLGLFDIPEDAARAYDEAAKKLYGEFAILNFE